jgi:hypothetical protein
MHCVVPPEYLPQRRAGKRCHHRNPTATKAPTLRQAAIKGLHQQSDPISSEPFTRRLPACHGLTSAPGKPEQITDPGPQAFFKPRPKPVWDHHRAACSPHEGPTAYRAF